jgi:hypothetical protein
MMNFKMMTVTVLAYVMISCGSKTERLVKVTNKLDLARREVISIKLTDLTSDSSEVNWKATSGDEELLTQLVDTDGDSLLDELLIYVEMKPMQSRQISVTNSNTEVKQGLANATYSRFVPERIDDYAWENDLVAFRTYGPVAQQLVEQGKPGGTLSSGLDCWFKRVTYPVINKWYKKYSDGGTYHIDDGEGYDPYHVGKSRGCGGIGVWKDDSLYVSKNFVSYKEITNGPVRSVFELSYAPWIADNTLVSEKKRITIDLGNQLYKIEEIVTTDKLLPNLTVGITLHDGKGKTSVDTVNGIFSYWEPVDDSEVGTAVVIFPEYVQTAIDYRTNKKDLSHLYILAKPKILLSYYTGFAWTKSAAITSEDSWKNYLNQFSQRLHSPLLIEVE